MSNLPTVPDEMDAPAALTTRDVRLMLDEFHDQEGGMAYGTQALRAKLTQDGTINIIAGKDSIVETYTPKKRMLAQVIVGVPARAFRAKGAIAGIEDDPTPICTSTDGGQSGRLNVLQANKYGITNLPNHQACVTCPYGGKNAWGTAVDASTGKPGKGKACREMRHLLLRVAEIGLPVIMTVSPTSIQAWDGYRTAFAAKQDSYFRYVTEISPDKITANGRQYGIVKFTEHSVISLQQFMEAKILRDEFMPTLYNITEDSNEEPAPQAAGGFGEDKIIDQQPDIPFE